MCGRYGRRADKQRIAEWMQTYDTNVVAGTVVQRGSADFPAGRETQSRDRSARVDRYAMGIDPVLVEGRQSRIQHD